ncbi:copper chaperone PCu(A)C [Limnohabitans sp. Rim11]|uniref:copper chaperone PCu(A)C n=1 Tax=Limnohabitans sp. Rim11 TaxID=1100719 RepID=UPI000B23FFB7|nr:copper chaperone PCu(A)C [Limnohabitans sp. Rim11]
MKRFTLLMSLALAALSSTAQVTVSEPWVRATVPQQKATGAFMKLQSAQDAKLISAKSAVAGVVEVHEMAMDAGVMKMRAVDGLALPMGKAVDLKPGGYHVMLMDLKSQLKDGDVVPLTLTFETKDGKRQTMEVKATARNMSAPAQPSHGGHSGMKH